MTTLALFAQESEGNPLGLIILLLPIAAIIFLTVVPQRRQKKKQAELMAQLAVGDEVVTIGGIHGVVTNVQRDADLITIRIDESTGTKIRVGASAVSRVVTDEDKNGDAARGK